MGAWKDALYSTGTESALFSVYLTGSAAAAAASSALALLDME